MTSPKLVRHRPDAFKRLRERWKITENSYESSFKTEDDLETIGEMGYSGSTFFATKDSKYLVKSVPRHFEHSFFRDDFVEPYVNYMLENVSSILIRITDFLAVQRVGLGTLLGTAPSHHIVMENLVTGQSQVRAAGGAKWQTWDLKPTSYFFPERDVAGGRLASQATKDRLADTFHDKLVLTQSQSDDLTSQLKADTKLLEAVNAVDYSLFLVRIPLAEQQDPFADPSQDPSVYRTDRNAPPPPQKPPFTPPDPPTWRTGIRSADGKYVFRVAILDFFWAKHTAHAQFMTFLIKCWNLVNRQGPMSITTTPQEYRTRFLGMCKDMIEIRDGP